MTSPDPTIANLLLVALALLDQCSDLLQQLEGDNSMMAYESAALPGSTIGKHLRHLTDHFALLCSSTQSASEGTETELSYDTRIRNGPAEVDAGAAEQGLAQLKATLRERAEKQWTSDQPVKLHAVTPFEVSTKSSVGREVCLFFTFT